MMNVGEFAALTGLSVKALRHYDERGVLAPAAVDPFTGYRKYSEGQARSGIILKTLRDAGVPGPDAAAGVSEDSDAAGAASAQSTTDAVSHVDAAADVLQVHRETVLRARAEEDRAYERALTTVRSLAQPVPVVERSMPAQPFVSVTLPVPVDSAVSDPEVVDTMNDEVSRSAEGLMRQLARDGIHPAGPLWISMRMRDRETVDLVCCLPVPHRLPAEWGGDGIEVGELPDRVELCAVWRGDDTPDGVTHPAVVGLLDAYAAHPSTATFSEARDIRQTVTGTSAEDWRVEIAVTVR